jgi:transcriptional regulator with XRE-family HTH domain
MESGTLYLQLGEKIRRARTGAGKTQAQAAAEIGISRASLANIEAGRQQILVHHLFAIARALDLNKVADLLPDTDAADVATSIVRSVLPIGRNVTEKQRQDISKLINDVHQQPKPTGKKQTR